MEKIFSNGHAEPALQLEHDKEGVQILITAWLVCLFASGLNPL